MKLFQLVSFFIILGIINARLIHLLSAIIPGKVTLQADNGLYLSRCHHCGPARSYQDSAALFQTTPSNPWDVWIVEKVGSQVAFKSDNGCYLTRCAHCWDNANFTDGVFVHVCDLKNNPWSLWSPEGLGNGKWAFKGDNGLYLSRCHNCAVGAYPDYAFVHVSTPQDNPWSQWSVNYVSKFPTGSVNIQSDIGTYVARCNKCGSANYPDSVGVHENNPNNSWSIWKVQFVGDKVAFKSDNGFYLTRCANCWASASYPDGVFAHVSTLTNNPWSLWTPQDLGNGKWALKGDNGNYLSRCNKCVKASYEDFAFVHVSTPPVPDNPWSQWTITSR